MKLELPENVATPADLAAVIADVRAYGSWASKELIKQKVAGKSAGQPPSVGTDAAAIIRAWSGGKPLTTAKIDSLIQALDAHKKSAPIITITLAGVPSGDLKRKLIAWVRKELDANLLISFNLNRQILGGLVVSYGSHIYDWSFRRKLMDSPIKFHEVLARV